VKLPRDKQILVYDETGQAAGMVSAVLNLLGYDAVNLKFGMTGWTRDDNIAPGRFEEFYPGTIKEKDILELPYCIKQLPGCYTGTTAVSDVEQAP
jgi:hypothetical protein